MAHGGTATRLTSKSGNSSTMDTWMILDVGDTLWNQKSVEAKIHWPFGWWIFMWNPIEFRSIYVVSLPKKTESWTLQHLVICEAFFYFIFVFVASKNFKQLTPRNLARDHGFRRLLGWKNCRMLNFWRWFFFSFPVPKGPRYLRIIIINYIIIIYYYYILLLLLSLLLLFIYFLRMLANMYSERPHLSCPR